MLHWCSFHKSILISILYKGYYNETASIVVVFEAFQTTCIVVFYHNLKCSCCALNFKYDKTPLRVFQIVHKLNFRTFTILLEDLLLSRQSNKCYQNMAEDFHVCLRHWSQILMVITTEQGSFWAHYKFHAHTLDFRKNILTFCFGVSLGDCLLLDI